MSKIIHLKKEQQQVAPLFNGAFVENKPIPFPDRGGTLAYSNLFYWAHLVAFETAEFPLHPHKGFEIMTFVFKGSLEHFDTATNVWTALKAGDVQVIQAGSGVQHAERIRKDSELFQIWFDPDFSKSLKKAPSYKDYPSKKFMSKKEKGIERISYLQEKGPIDFETQGLVIEKLSLKTGEYKELLDLNRTYSYYLLNGQIRINDSLLEKDSYIVFDNSDEITFLVPDTAELFVIQSPSSIEYKRFIQRY